MKGPGDFVSVADQRTESILVGELQKARAGYPILSEEVGLIDGPDKSHRFIIDPLDGTTNFLHGIPHFAISIGLERDGVLQSAVVFNPITDEMFTAERSSGAFLNDKRLRVAARRELSASLAGTGIPFIGRGDHKRFLGELGAVMATTTGVRAQWLGGARPGLGGGGTARRLLGTRPRGLGYRGGHPAGEGSRWHGQRSCGRRTHAGLGRHPGFQPGAAPPIPEASERCGDRRLRRGGQMIMVWTASKRLAT